MLIAQPETIPVGLFRFLVPDRACGVPMVGPSADSGRAFVFIDEAAEDRSADYRCVFGVIDGLGWVVAVGDAGRGGVVACLVADIFAEQLS